MLVHSRGDRGLGIKSVLIRFHYVNEDTKHFTGHHVLQITDGENLLEHSITLIYARFNYLFIVTYETVVLNSV